MSSSQSSDSKFQLGNTVSTSAHPYTAPNGSEAVKIGAYHHFTPPLMLVVAIHFSNYDPETGKQKISYQCIYYATSSGTFETGWFQEQELRSGAIDSEDKGALYKNNKDKSLAQVKKELLNTQVILRSVDLELQKKQVFKGYKNPNHYNEKPLLDFLPPLGTVIDVCREDNPLQYNKKTGFKRHEQSRYKLKLRWWNNKTSRFSEVEVPLCALKQVDMTEVAGPSTKQIYLYRNDSLELEENSEVDIDQVALRFEEIIFDHYKFKYCFKNCFTQEMVNLNKSELSKLADKETSSQLIKPPYQQYGPLSKQELKDLKGTWLRILYMAQTGKFTARIIYFKDYYPKEREEAGCIIIEANCLLRNGAKRHFRADRIRRYTKMTNEFESKFVK